MDDSVPGFPELVNIRRIWIRKIPFYESLESSTVAFSWSKKSAKRFHRCKTTDERQECTIVIYEPRNPPRYILLKDICTCAIISFVVTDPSIRHESEYLKLFCVRTTIRHHQCSVT